MHNKLIGAVGTAVTAAYNARKPAEFEGVWEDEEGRRVDVLYQPVEPAVSLRSFVNELYPLLPEQLSPLTKTKTGTQGYLFSIPAKAGRLISDWIGSVVPVDELVAGAIDRTVPDKTTRDALVKARIGQGQWRKDLLRNWAGRCAITGLEIETLLRASHIKPCTRQNPREKP